MSRQTKKQKIQLVNTGKENFKYLLPRQVLKAKRVRKVFQTMGMPTVKDLNAI
jgi:hypothetical protein